MPWPPVRLLDSERIDLFLSGSSARLLSREVATSMRGRDMEALVYPFSFREYLCHRRREPNKTPDHLTKAQGLNQRDRNELLRGYVDVALQRDVVERHAVSHPVALRWMVRQLLGNATGSFSVNKFHGDLKSQGIPIAKIPSTATWGIWKMRFWCEWFPWPPIPSADAWSTRARCIPSTQA